MAITEITRPYETLIRHNDDGSIGAHHVKISEVIKDGVVIAAQVLSPIPVADADLVSVIGDAAVAAISDADSVRSILAMRDANIVSLQTLLDQCDAQIVALRQECAILESKVRELSSFAN